jgi:N-acetylmuramic acid 6-phosphate etherase
LSNDVDLLSAVMGRHSDISSAIVLIAGTGSVAMRYSTESGTEPTRTARSGGWGNLLGDEGGGYSIGLEAVKHTLTVCEEVNLGIRPNMELGQLEQTILQRFGTSEAKDMDLLSEVLLGQHGGNVKTRIAAVAQVVLDLAISDTTAMGIASSQAKALVDTVLGRLIDPRSSTTTQPEKAGLVLSGGALMHETYQRLVLDRLAGIGIKFAYVEVVPDAAAAGAQSLALKRRVE